MNVIAIIPARYASTRFPGKPLVDIAGKTMIQRVYEKASKTIQDVFVATDDERIFSAVEAFGGKVIMTSPEHRSGTDRCYEALQKAMLLKNTKWDVVVNIQGDEPFIESSQLESLIQCFQNKDTDIATLVKRIETNDEVFNPNNVKAIFDKNKKAIYFSRSPIPYYRGEVQENWYKKHSYFKHLGIYAYRSKVLAEITALAPSALEIAESLEQNRWIENGYTIRIEETFHQSLAIDTPDDLLNAIQWLKNSSQ